MSRRLIPKLYAALLCAMALSPLYLLPGAALLPDRLWLAAALPVPALLLTGLAALQPAKRRVLALIFAMVLMAAGCAALFLRTKPLAMLLFLPCALTMLLFMPAMARPAHQEWSLRYLGAGLVLHIAAQFVKDIAVFASAAAPLSWIFVLYLLMLLFSYNRSMLMETGSASAKPLLKHNRVLLAVFCLAALVLSSLKAVGAAVRAAIAWIITALSAALLWLTSLFQQSTDGGAVQGSNPLAGFYDDAEPSTLSRIVEIALIAVGILVAAALLFFLFKHLFRLLRRAYGALMEKLRLFRRRISADYVDQSETMLNWREIRKTAAARLRRVKTRLFPTPWETLSPAQRVRRVYRLLLRRASAPDPALTAQEMASSGALRLPADAVAPIAALYDRARYSTHPISAQEADELRRQAGV